MLPTHTHKGAFITACFALLGCAEGSDAPPRERGSLVDPLGWASEDPELAPFGEHHGPETPACLPGGWGPEFGGLEVDTGECPYASLTQAARTFGRPGDLLHVEWWHQDLAAVEPGTGHLALAVGDEVLWEREVRIPFPARSYTDTVPIDVEFEPDAPVHLHLHNHGANTWTIFRVEVGPTEKDAS